MHNAYADAHDIGDADAKCNSTGQKLFVRVSEHTWDWWLIPLNLRLQTEPCNNTLIRYPTSDFTVSRRSIFINVPTCAWRQNCQNHRVVNQKVGICFTPVLPSQSLSHLCISMYINTFVQCREYMCHEGKISNILTPKGRHASCAVCVKSLNICPCVNMSKI